MSAYRCKNCGREFEQMPAACLCGNSDPMLWEAADAPQPQATDGQPPAYAPPQPQVPNGQPPAFVPPQPQVPNGQPPAYAPPQPQENGGGKNKKSSRTLLIVLLCAALAIPALGVGGYFAYKHFAGNNTASQSEDEDGGKKNNADSKKKNKEDPSEESAGDVETVLDADAQTDPAGINADETAEQPGNTVTAPDVTKDAETTAATTPTSPSVTPTSPTEPDTPSPSADGMTNYHNILIQIPDGFSLSEQDDDSALYMSDSGFTMLTMSYQEGTQDEWDELIVSQDDLTELMGLDDSGMSVNIKQSRQYKIDGHDAIYYEMEGAMDEMPGFKLNFNMVFVRMDKGVVMVMGGGLGGADAVNAALNSIRVK